MTKYEDLQIQINELEAHLNAHANLSEYLVRCLRDAGHLDVKDLAEHLEKLGGPPEEDGHETPNKAWLMALASACRDVFRL